MSKKTLGRSSGALNAPIAAFSMAVVLLSYCAYSINSARKSSSSSPSSPRQEMMQRVEREQRRQEQDRWVRRVLEEGGKGK